MHIVMLKKRMLLNFLSLLLMPALPVAAAETTEDFPAAEVHEDDVQAHLKAEEKHEDIRYPRLTLHGDYRFLYGKGRFNAETPDWRTGKSPRIDQSVFRAERRLRLFPFIETSKETSVRTMLEDKRDSKDETRNRHLTLSRLYLQHENPHTKLEAGRFNYYLMDGNIIDKRIDGLRFRTGGEDWPHGSLTVFAGRTTGTASSQKDGFSLLWKKRTGKLGFHTAYLDFHQREKLPKNYPQLRQLGLTAGRAGHGYDHQRIFSAAIRYHPREDWTLGLELLQAQGRHEADDYRENERGFVACLQYGQLDEEEAGSFSSWIHYYDQPSASVLWHTMDADAGFFRRQGFRGLGVRTDYVITPGLSCAIEGFRLENRKESTLLSHMHQYVLGTSITAHF